MILGKLWKWLAAGAAAVAGVLFALLQVTQHQRDKAKARADREAAGRKAVESTQDAERAVHKAQQGARTDAAAAEKEADQLRQDGRRRDVFGDPRLGGDDTEGKP